MRVVRAGAVVLAAVFALGGGILAEDASAAGCGLLGLEDCPPPPCGQPTDGTGAVIVDNAPIAPLPSPLAGQPLFPRTTNGHLPYGFTENGATNGSGLASPTQVGEIHRAVGGSLVRFDLNWGKVQEQQGGDLCFNFYDVAYKALVARGVRPVFIIDAVPQWAAAYPDRCGTPTFCQSFPKSEKYPDFRAFAEETARRYPLAGAIEIWNEPNGETAVSSPPDPAHYAEVLTEAYEGIKDGNPAMRVLAFALAPVDNAATEPRVFSGNGKYVYGDGNFIRDTLAHGVQSKLDGVSFHPYPKPFSSSVPPTDPTRFNETFLRIRDGLVAGGTPLGSDGHPTTRLVPDEVGYAAAYGDVIEMMNQSAVMMERFEDLDVPDSTSPVMADRVDAVIFFSGIDPKNNSPYGWVTQRNALLGGFVPKTVFCDFRREVANLGNSCQPIP